jgi:hypothetical protein
MMDVRCSRNISLSSNALSFHASALASFSRSYNPNTIRPESGDQLNHSALAEWTDLLYSV